MLSNTERTQRNLCYDGTKNITNGIFQIINKYWFAKCWAQNQPIVVNRLTHKQ